MYEEDPRLAPRVLLGRATLGLRGCSRANLGNRLPRRDRVGIDAQLEQGGTILCERLLERSGEVLRPDDQVTVGNGSN